MSALTKILIVLQLVFSLVCAVLLVLMVSKMEPFKTSSEAANARAVGLQAQLTKMQADNADLSAQVATSQGELAKLNDQIKTLTATSSDNRAKLETEVLAAQNALASAQSQVKTLTATISTLTAQNGSQATELTRLRPQVGDLIAKNTDINRALSEANNQVRAAELQIRKLQEALAAKGTGATAAAGSVGGGEQVQTFSNVAPSTRINSKVSDVAQSAGRVHIEMPLGTRDGIQVGTKLYVYRANSYVGDATVESVTQNQAVAVVMSTKPGETVQVGDFVATTGQ